MAIYLRTSFEFPDLWMSGEQPVGLDLCACKFLKLCQVGWSSIEYFTKALKCRRSSFQHRLGRQLILLGSGSKGNIRCSRINDSLRTTNHPLSNTFFAASTTLFISACPFSTTFSIIPCAFFKSSGLALLSSCIARIFFCCLPLASLIPVAAFSPAFTASVTAARRDSVVGGGMLMTSSKGLVPVGSGCGVRDRLED